MQNKQKPRRVSKSEQALAYAVRNHKDLSTPDIEARLTYLQKSIDETDETVINLRAKLVMLQSRLQADRATALGLESILDSRR